MKYRYSEQMKNITAEEMRTFFRIGHEKAAVNLFSGDPPADCLPVADLAAAAERCFAKPDPDAFSYATGYGYAPLRVRLAGYARTVLKIGAESDSILITEGAVQAIDAIVSVFCNPDDAVVVDQLTSPFVLMLLKQKGIEVIPVEMDNEGMVPERLAAILAGNPRIKLVYLTPDFQVPTGVTVPEARRRRLLEVVKKYDVALIEDGSASQLRLYEEDLLPMKAMDDAGCVIYVGSLSQVLAPGLRVGYVIAGDEILQRAAAWNRLHAAGGPSVTQMLAAEYLSDRNRLLAHIDRCCEVYRDRYEQMVRLIESRFPEDIYFSMPDGGLYLWCTDVSEQINTTRLASRLLEKYGISIAPGAVFTPEKDRYRHSFCLNYTVYEGEELAGIMEKIAAECRDLMPGNRS